MRLLLQPMIYIGITLTIFTLGFVISEYELKHQRGKRRTALKTRCRRAINGDPKC